MASPGEAMPGAARQARHVAAWLGWARLGAALHGLAQRSFEQYGLQVDVATDPLAEPPTEALLVLLFRSVQELLLNVVKHADADGASVRLRWHESGVEVAVSDDGKGFEAAAPAPDESRSFGLFSIQERFDDLGGRVAIRSRPGEGTTVTLVLPYRAEAGEETE